MFCLETWWTADAALELWKQSEEDSAKISTVSIFHLLNSNILLKVNWPNEKCFKRLPKETSVGWRRSFANQFWILSSFRHNIHFPHYDICFCRMLFRFRFIWSAACTLHVLDIWLVKHMPYKMQFFSPILGELFIHISFKCAYCLYIFTK